MNTTRMIWIGLGAEMLVLAAGCQSYHDFEAARARSETALAALGDQGRTIDEDDPADLRRERLRYIQLVQGKIGEADKLRLTAMGEKWSASDARRLETAMLAVYAHMETLARIPARLKEDGTPADAETAALLKAAEGAVVEMMRE